MDNLPEQEPQQERSMASRISTLAGKAFKSATPRQWISLALVVGVLFLAGWAIGARAALPDDFMVQSTPSPESPDETELAAGGLYAIDVEDLPVYPTPGSDPATISRTSDVHTIIPSRPRLGILKYTVQQGDTLFGISEKFGLKPESILWGNWYEMSGDPHLLRPDQELKILPVDGALHVWSEGEGLNGVAEFYGVTAQEILDWPGNPLEPDLDPSNPEIEAGTELVIPGGRREPPSWQMVRITRSNAAVASILGPGACSATYSGPIGDGIFGWPTPSTWISGYNYLPGVHEAIDIGGSTGNAIYAADDGVVVYAGWNDWGYGYVIVLDHGNGWQTLYAHLSQVNVGCGQAVYQGNVIAGMGCTGNCSGTHLHFEMRNDVFGRVNPANFLP
jgi:murein DD-endopeptidase MepM/ murein hydrolase activator NlpD